MVIQTFLILKEFFKYIASPEKKYVDYTLIFNNILTPSGNTTNFLQKYGYLYNFWIDALLENTNRDNIYLKQANFLKDLMNGFIVHKNIEKTKKGVKYKAEDLYLKLFGNLKKTVDEILFKKSKDAIYSTKLLTQRQERCLNLKNNL